MRNFIYSLLVALVLSLFGAPAHAEEPAPQNAVIVGDSITEWYNDIPGSPSRGWWSFVAEHYNLTPTVAAEAGSGYWNIGKKCSGTRFGGRLHLITAETDVAFVAGGFNDDYGCTADGRKVPIKRTSSERAVTLYLEALADKADSVGLPRHKIYVFTPWGIEKRDTHYWMWRRQKAEAERLGMTYLTVRFLDDHQLRDGIHPNLAGSEKLAERVIITAGSSL